MHLLVFLQSWDELEREAMASDKKREREAEENDGNDRKKKVAKRK